MNGDVGGTKDGGREGPRDGGYGGGRREEGGGAGKMMNQRQRQGRQERSKGAGGEICGRFFEWKDLSPEGSEGGGGMRELMQR